MDVSISFNSTVLMTRRRKDFDVTKPYPVRGRKSQTAKLPISQEKKGLRSKRVFVVADPICVLS